MQLQKPDYTTSIVSVLAGETIPEAFLLKLLTENRSAVGFVVQDKKLEIEKFTGLASIENELENFRAILVNTIKYNRVFYFSSFPAEFDEDEIQPWRVLKDSKGNPILAVGIEGDFPLIEGEGDSEMLGMINEIVGPKIEAMYQLLGNNPTKLYAAMKDKTFADDILSNVGHRGHFVFMPITGDVFSHFKEDESLPQNGKFAWGSASFTYGYTEAAPAAAEPAPVKQVHTPKMSKYATAPTEEPKIRTDDNGIHTLPGKTVEVPKVETPPAGPVENAASKVVEGHWETPPVNVHGKKLKGWYRAINFTAGILNAKGEGDLPGDWNKRPRIWVGHKTVVKSLSELSQTAIGSTVKEPTQSVLPVIDGKQQAAANEFIKKYLDGASNEVSNPLELQKEEAKLAIFSELCLGGNLDRIERWKTAGKLAFIKANPEAAWLLLNELILDRIKRKTTSAIGEKKLGELTGTLNQEITPEPIKEPIAPSSEPEKPAIHTPKKVSKYA